MLKSTDIVSYIQTSLITVIHVGTPKQPLILLITNTDFNSICISSRLYNESSSSSFKNENTSNQFVIKKNKYFIGNYSSETVIMKGLEVNNIQFLLFKNKNVFNINDGIIGLDLSSNVNLPNVSLIDQLHKKGLISYKTFSLQFDEDTDIGEIILGSKPPITDDELLHFQKCTIPKIENSWICLMNNSKQLGIDVKNVNKALFKIDYSFISSPPIYFNYITEVYLSNAIQENKCVQKRSERDNVEWIECRRDMDINKLNSLSFCFDSINIILHPKDLFIILPFHNDTMVFGIVLDKLHSQYNWIFGDIALKQYNMIFDFDKKEMLFSNQRIIEHNESTNNKYMYIIYVIMVFGVPTCIILYVKWKNNKRKLSQINKDWNLFMNLEAFNLQLSVI